jgi:hypothetical protein
VLADLATAGISGTLNIPVRVTTDLLVLIGLPQLHLRYLFFLLKTK